MNVQTSYGNTSQLSKTPVDPISHESVTLYRRCIVAIWLSFSSMGMCTNAINVHTFIRMKLEESITISFFAMAVSDFCNCCLGFAEGVGTVLDLLEEDLKLWFRIAPFVVLPLAETSRKAFSCMAALVTTYIAVQRCLCVLVPFRVKGMFTNFKTYCFLVLTFSFLAVSYSLLLWRHSTIEIQSPFFENATQTVLYVMPGSEPFFFMMYGFTGVILNVGSQFVVVICLIIMFVMLKKSIRFKKDLTSSGPPNKKRDQITDGKDSKQESQANAKEIQALKQVALVSLIFVSANSIFVGIGVAKILIPEFEVLKAYHNFFELTIVTMVMAEQINASVNIFVYYNFNTKFRNMCRIKWRQ